VEAVGAPNRREHKLSSHNHQSAHFPELSPWRAIEGQVLISDGNTFQEPAESRRVRESGELESFKMLKKVEKRWNGLRKGSLKAEREIKGIARIRRSKKIGSSRRTLTKDYGRSTMKSSECKKIVGRERDLGKRGSINSLRRLESYKIINLMHALPRIHVLHPDFCVQGIYFVCGEKSQDLIIAIPSCFDCVANPTIHLVPVKILPPRQNGDCVPVPNEKLPSFPIQTFEYLS
jgi:hypothetical protein